MAAPPLFSAVQLAVTAGKRLLLDGLDITVPAGGMVGVMGPSGCGKSTLLRGLAMLHDGVKGRVSLDGRTPAQIGWPQWRRSVVYMTQMPLLFDTTVLENLERPFTYAGAPGTFPRDRAVELLGQLGIAEKRLKQAARTLSVGQQQRVCLVRAMLLEPKVILLDEPTSALDGGAADDVFDLINAERQRGMAVLLVSHDPLRAREHSDSVVNLTPHLKGGADE